MAGVVSSLPPVHSLKKSLKVKTHKHSAHFPSNSDSCMDHYSSSSRQDANRPIHVELVSGNQPKFCRYHNGMTPPLAKDVSKTFCPLHGDIYQIAVSERQPQHCQLHGDYSAISVSDKCNDCKMLEPQPLSKTRMCKLHATTDQLNDSACTDNSASDAKECGSYERNFELNNIELISTNNASHPVRPREALSSSTQPFNLIQFNERLDSLLNGTEAEEFHVRPSGVDELYNNASSHETLVQNIVHKGQQCSRSKKHRSSSKKQSDKNHRIEDIRKTGTNLTSSFDYDVTSSSNVMSHNSESDDIAGLPNLSNLDPREYLGQSIRTQEECRKLLSFEDETQDTHVKNCHTKDCENNKHIRNNSVTDLISDRNFPDISRISSNGGKVSSLNVESVAASLPYYDMSGCRSLIAENLTRTEAPSGESQYLCMSAEPASAQMALQPCSCGCESNSYGIRKSQHHIYAKQPGLLNNSDKGISDMTDNKSIFNIDNHINHPSVIQSRDSLKPLSDNQVHPSLLPSRDQFFIPDRPGTKSSDVSDLNVTADESCSDSRSRRPSIFKRLVRRFSLSRRRESQQSEQQVQEEPKCFQKQHQQEVPPQQQQQLLQQEEVQEVQQCQQHCQPQLKVKQKLQMQLQPNRQDNSKSEVGRNTLALTWRHEIKSEPLVRKSLNNSRPESGPPPGRRCSSILKNLRMNNAICRSNTSRPSSAVGSSSAESSNRHSFSDHSGNSNTIDLHNSVPNNDIDKDAENESLNQSKETDQQSLYRKSRQKSNTGKTSSLLEFQNSKGSGSCWEGGGMKNSGRRFSYDTDNRQDASSCCFKADLSRHTARYSPVISSRYNRDLLCSVIPCGSPSRPNSCRTSPQASASSSSRHRQYQNLSSSINSIESAKANGIQHKTESNEAVKDSDRSSFGLTSNGFVSTNYNSVLTDREKLQLVPPPFASEMQALVPLAFARGASHSLPRYENSPKLFQTDRLADTNSSNIQRHQSYQNSIRYADIDITSREANREPLRRNSFLAHSPRSKVAPGDDRMIEYTQIDALATSAMSRLSEEVERERRLPLPRSVSVCSKAGRGKKETRVGWGRKGSVPSSPVVVQGGEVTG